MRTRIDPQKYDRYRLCLPGNMSQVEALVWASEYTGDNPILINTPALAGNWEIGYCDYQNFRRALAPVARLWRQACTPPTPEQHHEEP